MSTDLPKAASPRAHSTRGLVLADAGGRAVLDGGALEAPELWITEGLPDYLTLASSLSDADEDAPAVLGLLGSGSWTSAFADRIPDGVRVVIATHDDPAGDRYAAAVVGDSADAAICVAGARLTGGRHEHRSA